jgi:tetratricopeptide (TPR) repeat protein/pimeloyl-ACP methyl ester carboxylesterase
MVDATLVTVHGFWSAAATWDKLVAELAGDKDLEGFRHHPFEYDSPKKPRFPFSPTRIPSLDDVAGTFKTEYSVKLSDADNIVIIAHSQGGLIVQRFLWQMLIAGRGRDLARLRLVVLLACPIGGSQYLQTVRKVLGFGNHPQAGNLGVLDEWNADVQSYVLQHVVNADQTDDHNCRIRFRVYAGASDNVVTAGSAKGAFPDADMLPGDHSTILDPAAPGNRTAAAIKRDLLTVLPQPPIGTPTPQSRSSQPLNNLDLPVIPRLMEIARRDKDLERCRNALMDHRLVVVQGPPGIGKSTFAREYAAGFQQDYEIVWRITCHDQAQVDNDLEDLANALLPAKDTDNVQAARMFKLLWELKERRSNWLLIFDGLEDTSLVARAMDVLMSNGTALTGHVLVFSQSLANVVSNRGTSIHLGPLSAESGTDYLKRMCPELSDHDAGVIADHARGQPKYLNTAVEVLRLSDQPLKAIIDGIEDRLMDDGSALWEATISHLERTAPDALDLLKVSAFFAEHRIPLGLLESPVSALPPTATVDLPPPSSRAYSFRRRLAEPEVAARALNVLDRETFSGSFQSGPVEGYGPLARHLRSQMPGKEREAYLRLALQLACDAMFDSWKSPNFTRCRQTLPHAERVLELTRTYGIARAISALLLIRIGHHHRSRGNVSASTRAFRQALELRIQLFGADSPQVTHTLCDAGMALTDARDYDAGIHHLEEAIRREEARAPEPDDDNLARCQHNLGWALAESGRVADSVRPQVAAISYWTRMDHSEGLARCLGSLGRSLYLLGDFDHASDVLARAVKAARVSNTTDRAHGGGISELGMAEIFHYRGQVLRARGRDHLLEAKAYHQDALEFRETTSWEGHPGIEESRIALARVLSQLGETTEAETRLREAYESMQFRERAAAFAKGDVPAMAAPNDVDRVAYLQARAELELSQENLDAAHEYLVQAETLCERSISIARIEHADILETLGRIREWQVPGSGTGAFDGARRLRDAIAADLARIELPASLFNGGSGGD